MNYSTGLAGFVVAMINKRRVAKALKDIQKSNDDNKDIVHYQPSQIEAFFDENEPINNMVISGGLNSIRCRAIVRSIECAYMQGYSVVVLHNSNAELEAQLLSAYGNQYINCINRSNPIYDPFYKRSNAEISRLVIESGQSGFEIGSVGKYYLDGISDFIRAKNLLPYIQMYIDCPHMELFNKVQKLEKEGGITDIVANSITSRLMQGESERGNIEFFFSRFNDQCEGIVATKKRLKYAINVAISSARKQILAIDIQSSTNALLLNMIANEIKMELELGKKLLIIADNIQINTSKALESLIKESGNNSAVLLSGDDVFSEIGGDDNTFYAFMGKISKSIISKHASAYSCQKFSDYFGQYDKKEITATFAENTNYVNTWGMGATNTANVNIRRENVVKAETINRMNMNEVFVTNRYTGELAHTTVI